MDKRLEALAQLLDVLRVPGTIARTRWIVGCTAVLVGGVAAWRLAPLVTPPSTGPAAADVPQQAAASAWIKARAKAIVTIRERADLTPEALLESVLPDLTQHGLSREDGHAALTHAADIVYTRFVDRDLERYTALRRESG